MRYFLGSQCNAHRRFQDAWRPLRPQSTVSKKPPGQWLFQPLSPQVLASPQQLLDILVGNFALWVMSNVVIQAALLLKNKWNYNHTAVCSSWFHVAEGLLSYVKLPSCNVKRLFQILYQLSCWQPQRRTVHQGKCMAGKPRCRCWLPIS